MRRRRRSADEGTSIFEMTLVMSLLSMAVAAALGFVAQSQTSMKRMTERSQSNDQANLAVQRLDRLIRSGNILYNPAEEQEDLANDIRPGLSMRVYTQANAVQKCVQWRITGAGDLQERSWSPEWAQDNLVSEWWTVTDGLVNDAASPAFSLNPSSGFGGRLLELDLRVNTSPAHGTVISQRSSVEGRNTQYGYDPVVCESIPPY